MSASVFAWGAFVSPPPGSNLAIVVADLERSAAAGELTAEALRPIIAADLEWQGAPPAPREAWLERLIDEKAVAVAKSVATMSTVRLAGGPSTFAALVGLATFFRCFRARHGALFEDLCLQAAQELGPGVGAHEVERLVRYHLAITRNMSDQDHALFVSAVSVVGEQCEDLPMTNLSVNETEFLAIAGVIDGTRFHCCPYGLPLSRR